MKVRFIGALLLLVMSVQVAGAADKANPAVNASDKDSFQTVSEWVRKQMDAGGRYAETNGEERQVVNARLDEMSKLFEQKSSVDQMSIDEKKKLLVDQEEINSILGFVEQLKEVNVEGVEPMTSVTPMKLPMREDKVTDGGYAKRVLANAPQSEEGFFLVPKVVE